MLMSQIIAEDGENQVVVREGTEAYVVNKAKNIYSLAMEAAETDATLTDIVSRHGLGVAVDLESAYHNNRILTPISHEDEAHLYVTGTGLTHLGSASSRDTMHHSEFNTNETNETDSMKMFRMGLKSGKPEVGSVGVQPEWFYKGNGGTLVSAGSTLFCPAFADDGGEEPEIAGIYIIGKDGTPFRVGFVLANEFSDHVMEEKNYLYLAHSKLRQTALGPEILVGELPKDIRGNSRIHRNGKTIWEKSFLSGENNMSHTLSNLEHHHFKYAQFRRPGDVHIHLFGTATISFSDGIIVKSGDVFEIEVEEFGLSLRNLMEIAPPEVFSIKSM